ncbi:hypothetical protein, partial [Altererythrobacter sp.]
MPILIDQSSFWTDLDNDGEIDEGEVVYYDLRHNEDDDATTGSQAEINGALFFTDQPDSSAGTGLIQAFVRVQDGGGGPGDGLEAGYNTSARPLAYEENTSPSFTKSLLLNQVPIVTIDGVDYYEFRLDINQLNSGELLSLDALKLYTSDVGAGDLTGLITDASFTNATTLVYDLDDADLDGNPDTNNSILLDYSLQAGSGKSDMFFYVPVSNFGGVNPDETYVTLYSEFGYAGVLDADDNLVAIDDPTAADDVTDANPTSIYGTYSANDGFEEWSVSKELGLFVSGFKWEDSDGDGVWDVGENGLADWQISYEYTVKIKGVDVVISGVVETSDGTDDLNGDGVPDPIGYYVIPLDFTNKNYTVTITESAPGTLTPGDLGGWINTYDGDGGSDGVILFQYNKNTDPESLPQGLSGTAGALDFGNFELFDISGTKYTDTNGDGQTAGDSGLGGVTIFIDKDGSGTLTAGDETTTTAANGTWSFTNLDASYAGLKVYEVLPNGYVQTLGQAGYTITGTSGTDQTGLNFANFELFDISGTKYTDTNGDGQTAGDSG